MGESTKKDRDEVETRPSIFSTLGQMSKLTFGEEDLEEGTANSEKTWWDIVQELSCDLSVLWSYITVMRGPDTYREATSVKLVFTCPLRGRCLQALDVGDFLSLRPDEVKAGFIDACERNRELRHYLSHIAEIWLEIYPPLGKLLTDAFVGRIDPEKAARRYTELIIKWLRGSSVLMGGKDKPRE